MIVSGIAISGIIATCSIAFSSGIMWPGFLFSGKNRIVHGHLPRIHFFLSSFIRMGGRGLPLGLASGNFCRPDRF
jgi:hypothetical protein